MDLCIKSINLLLVKRGLPTLDKERYTDIFTFPVKEYYENAGFDFSKEKFEIPAMKFIELYHKGLKGASLHRDAVKALKYFDSMGLEQYILSAMEHNSLLKSLSDNNIKDYFIDVNGIDNHFAHSKLEIGKSMLKNISHKNEDLLLIGDTLHDKDVADGLGIRHLLITNGHQSKKRLLEHSSFVIDSLRDIYDLFE